MLKRTLTFIQTMQVKHSKSYLELLNKNASSRMRENLKDLEWPTRILHSDINIVRLETEDNSEGESRKVLVRFVRNLLLVANIMRLSLCWNDCRWYDDRRRLMCD